MSADADRIAYCKHGDPPQICNICLLDRIATLTAELAEARKLTEEARQQRDGYGIELTFERAAHEHTKAELATMEARAQSAWAEVRDAIESLKIAHAERDAFREERNGLAVKLARRIDDNIGWTEDSRAALKREVQAAQAEAVGMRDAMRRARECIQVGEHLQAHGILFDGGYTAGRALAARVPLLEAVATFLDSWSQWALNSYVASDVVTRENLQALRKHLALPDADGTRRLREVDKLYREMSAAREKLAALDAQEPK